MNKYVLASISTLAGAVGGFFAGKFYYDKKYSKRADEEVESVKQALGFYNEKEDTASAEEQSDKKPQVVTNSLDVAELKNYQKSVDILILFPIKNAPNPLPTSNTDDCIF